MDPHTEKLATEVVDAIFAVHRELGPGLLESVYEECLSLELRSRGIRHERQTAVPVVFRGQRVDIAFRVDLIVDGRLLLELKAVESLLPVHKAQAITYLKLLRLPLGLLVNFNVPLIKDGIKRVINTPAA